MLNPIRGTRGMAVAPHALASQSALAVLREGGNAVEAMVAAAATIAVVYPHMNSIGGDSFWLVHVPGRDVRGIDACGAAAQAASIGWYRERGIATAIPFRGGVAANTVAGTISGWALACEAAREMGGRLPLSRLLADAIHHAQAGSPVTRSQHVNTATKRAELAPQPGFAGVFLPGGQVPATGARFVQPASGPRSRGSPRRGSTTSIAGSSRARSPRTWPPPAPRWASSTSRRTGRSGARPSFSSTRSAGCTTCRPRRRGW